jgi:serine/threonine protein kinase
VCRKAAGPTARSEDWEAKQFAAEKASLCRVTHRSICRLFAFSGNGPERCLVLELCTGGPLDTRLKCDDGKHPPLQWQHRLRIAQDIACAVEHLHSLTPPMLHRDLKTANVLLDAAGNAKVADFGTVREGVGEDRTHVSTAAVGTQGCECRSTSSVLAHVLTPHAKTNASG